MYLLKTNFICRDIDRSGKRRETPGLFRCNTLEEVLSITRAFSSDWNLEGCFWGRWAFGVYAEYDPNTDDAGALAKDLELYARARLKETSPPTSMCERVLFPNDKAMTKMLFADTPRIFLFTPAKGIFTVDIMT